MNLNPRYTFHTTTREDWRTYRSLLVSRSRLASEARERGGLGQRDKFSPSKNLQGSQDEPTLL